MSESAKRERHDGGPRDRDKPPLPPPLPSNVGDSHCHLDLMDDTVEEAIAEAAAVGIDRFVTIGIDVASSQWCASVAESHPSIWAAAAIHPNEAPACTDEDLRAIEAIAQLPHVRAVGETGLDHFRTGLVDHAKQEESFRAHIQIAKSTGKALVIHDRDAHEDVLRVLLEEGAPELTVFHCFSGDAEMAKICNERGYIMSFAGNITFKNAQHLRDAVAVASPELILVETDAPFLTPTPHRGKANAPYLIPLTLACMAQVRNTSLEDICVAINATFTRAFAPLQPC